MFDPVGAISSKLREADIQRSVCNMFFIDSKLIGCHSLVSGVLKKESDKKSQAQVKEKEERKS